MSSCILQRVLIYPAWLHHWLAGVITAMVLSCHTSRLPYWSRTSPVNNLIQKYLLLWNDVTWCWVTLLGANKLWLSLDKIDFTVEHSWTCLQGRTMSSNHRLSPFIWIVVILCSFEKSNLCQIWSVSRDCCRYRTSFHKFCSGPHGLVWLYSFWFVFPFI